MVGSASSVPSLAVLQAVRSSGHTLCGRAVTYNGLIARSAGLARIAVLTFIADVVRKVESAVIAGTAAA